jgi:hypothetical protein
MWRRSDKSLSVSVTDYVFLVYTDNEQPVLIKGPEFYMVPIFSTIEKLEEYKPILNPRDSVKVKQIMDGIDFLTSIHEGGARVIIDPYIHNGNTRFTLVQMGD